MGYEEFARKLLDTVRGRRILITSHMNADDDAIGSVLAMSYLLEGEDVSMVLVGDVQSRYASFSGFERIRFVKEIAGFLEQADCAIMMDANEWSRVTSERIGSVPETFVIDHHENGSCVHEHLIEPHRASTCDIVYDIFYADKDVLSKQVCEAILLGILGDTGMFRFVNASNAQVLGIAQRLITDAGISVEEFTSRYQSISRDTFTLFTHFMENAKVMEREGWPPFLVSWSEDTAFSDDVVSAASHLFVQYTKTIEGVSWGFVLSRRSAGSVAISFRSMPGSVDVRSFTQRMGIGGGHVRAAGGRFSGGTVDQALASILSFIEGNTPDYA